MGPLGVLVDSEVGNATSRPFRGEGGGFDPRPFSSKARKEFQKHGAGRTMANRNNSRARRKGERAWAGQWDGGAWRVLGSWGLLGPLKPPPAPSKPPHASHQWRAPNIEAPQLVLAPWHWALGTQQPAQVALGAVDPGTACFNARRDVGLRAPLSCQRYRISKC